MGSLVSIQDKSATNALFSGALKYCQTRDFKLSGSNVIKEANKTAQQTYTASDGVDINKYRNAHNRKKSEVQYTAFTSPNITFDIIFKYDEKDIVTRTVGGVAVSMLTLGEFMHIVNTPKTFYLTEEATQAQLSSGLYPYYSTYGIPVVVKTWTLSVLPNKDVVANITLVEDIDEYI